MRWEDEPWIKLYTRDTVTWRRWDWEARTVFLHLLRKVDRSGIMELGNEQDAAGAIALLIDVPPAVVDRALPQMLAGEKPSVVIRNSVVVIPAFIEAQSSSTSPSQRQRVHRERKRDYARARALGVVVESDEDGETTEQADERRVTPRDETITKRDKTITKRDNSPVTQEREPRLIGERGTTAGTFGLEDPVAGFEQDVTKRDGSVTKRDGLVTKRDGFVTGCHGLSRAVTNRREEKRSEERGPISAVDADTFNDLVDSKTSATDPSGAGLSDGLSLTLSPPEAPKARGGQRGKAETQRQRAEELWDWYEDTRIKGVQRARRRVATKQQIRQVSELLQSIVTQLGCSPEEAETWFRRFGEGVIRAAAIDEKSRPYSCDDGTFRVNRWNNWYARNEKHFAKAQRTASQAGQEMHPSELSDVDRIRAQREKWAASQDIPDAETMLSTIPN